jgi:hypothetical protein
LVHPETDAGDLTHTGRHVIQAHQFGFGFHVKAQNLCRQRLAHLGHALAHAGKHHLAS